jgi:hypothetical protein
MKIRYSFMLAGLAMTFAFATPVVAQDVAKEDDAAATEKMEAHAEMMGEGCQCSCMKDMHEKMMKMHGEGEGHAEGMASDEDHAEMMAAHKDMMAGCKCMSGEGDGEMSCKMHDGEMGEGKGMQHRHGMDHGDADEDAAGG